MTHDDPARIDDALIALRQILRATDLHERELAQAAGLTPAKLRVMQILATLPDRSATPTALSGRMGVSQATITTLVDQLEQRGLAQRQRSQLDRRQLRVVLTSPGADLLSTLPDTLQQKFVQGFARMAEWEQSMLIANLQRVAALLDASQIEAAPLLSSADLRRNAKDRPAT